MDWIPVLYQPWQAVAICQIWKFTGRFRALSGQIWKFIGRCKNSWIMERSPSFKKWFQEESIIN
ncbi:hypothetical protein [Sporolactobacillus sp. KGMB 08714]|uniref:hypothetical protein n=1 Tax=Sporolactobacillus sp. KGMB 08714 TaxID=3064704 RepID=UPI002FBE6255